MTALTTTQPRTPAVGVLSALRRRAARRRSEQHNARALDAALARAVSPSQRQELLVLGVRH